jgi:uracil-DNA glycosylase family 4
MIVCFEPVPSDRLAVLEAEIVTCRRCPRLVAWREQVPARAAYRGDPYWRRPVPGFGDPDATVVVVGLAPAAHGGNRTGRMFTGDRSGDWLYRAMWRAGFANQPESRAIDDGLALRGAWVSASVRCAPPANKPTPEERAACLGYLRAELSLLSRMQVVVALGKLACDTVTSIYGLSPRPRFGHLVEHELPAHRVLLCSYHPSQQNTFTGKLTEEMLDAVFARARTLSTRAARRGQAG